MRSTRQKLAVKKPCARDDYLTREAFIRDKYVSKRFVGDLSPSQEHFLRACVNDDIRQAMTFFAASGSLGAVSDSVDQPIFIATKNGSISVVVFLVLNGADISETTSTDVMPLIVIAKEHDRGDIANYLMRKADLIGVNTMSSRSYMTIETDSPSPSPDKPAVDKLKAESPGSSGSAPHSPDDNRIILPNRMSAVSQSFSFGNSSRKSDIGERLHAASESSSAAGKVLEKLISKGDEQVDKIKSGFVKVLHAVGHVASHVDEGSPPTVTRLSRQRSSSTETNNYLPPRDPRSRSNADERGPPILRTQAADKRPSKK